MSLSKPRTNTSPVSRRFELKLAVGSVTHYEANSKSNVTVVDPAGTWENEKNYTASPSFKFVVLDVLSMISGYSDEQKSGIWSNEVRSTRDEEFIVRTARGVLLKGLYSDIKGDLAKEGGKFGNSVYLAYADGGEWKLGNLKLIGAGLSAWFDFREGKRLDFDPGVEISGWTGKKKGRNEYFEPVFSSWAVPPADLSAASALDETLQEFLSAAPVKEETGFQEPPRQTSFDGIAAPPF